MFPSESDRFEAFLDLLKQFVRQPSVVGCEEPFFRVLRRELEEHGVRVTHYEGLLVAEGRRPASMYLSAHIDRHGLMCTGPNEFQYAAFIAQNRADQTGNSVSEQTYNALTDRFAGQAVQAYEPWSGNYLGQGTIRNSFTCPRRGNLVFELDGLEQLSPGVPVAYLDRLTIAEGRLAAQLDNVACVAMLVHLFSRGFEGTAFFTAQEEVGRSWRYLLEWFHRFDRATDRLLVLDNSPFPDIATADAQDLVLRRRDASAPFNPPMVEFLEDRCRSLKIRYSYKDQLIDRENRAREKENLPARSLGRTELGRLIAASGGRVTGATVQLPTTGYHTAGESVSFDSVQALFGLLEELL